MTDPKAQPLISIIIPMYRVEDVLGETIESAINQTYTNWEMILLDDGSPDASFKVAQKYAARDDRIQAHQQPNQGHPSVTRNRAAAMAKGDYLAFLDSDDVWLPEKLERQLAFLQQNPDFEAVACAYDLFGDPEVLDHWLSIWQFHRSGHVTFEMQFAANRLATPCIMLRREAFEAVGGFDEAPELINGEDVDLWLRLTARHPIGYLEVPMTRVRLRPMSASRNEKPYIKDRAGLYTLKKLQGLGAPVTPKMAKEKEAEIYYARGIEMLYNRNGKFRADFIRAARMHPTDPKKLATALSTWLPAPLLKNWLRTLLSLKKKLGKNL